MIYSESLVDKIAEKVEQGELEGRAAIQNDVKPSTLSSWKKKHSYVQVAISDACQVRKGYWVHKLQNTTSNWQRYAWLLERMYANEFAPPKQTYEAEVKQEINGGAVSKFLKSHPEVTDAILDGIEKGMVQH